MWVDQMQLLFGIITLKFKRRQAMSHQQQPSPKLKDTLQRRLSRSSEQRRWGKYRPILGKNNKGQPLLTLGPNFLTLTACFLALNLFTAIFLYRLNTLQETTSFFIILTFNTIFVDLAWLVTALLNPGMSNPSPQQMGEICEPCLLTNNIDVSKKMNRYHCPQCEICIDEHEAHLKLLGCCIGRKNFLAFKVFLLGIFLWGLSMVTIIPMTYNL